MNFAAIDSLILSGSCLLEAVSGLVLPCQMRVRSDAFGSCNQFYAAAFCRVPFGKRKTIEFFLLTGGAWPRFCLPAPPDADMIGYKRKKGSYAAEQ
ncbi:MAG: hypothetical protein J6J99_01610 [Oscillibacter sp.]|nr:hypothetical protein [Oscillibacter sp.]